MRFFFDTNVIIDFLRGEARVVERLRDLADEDICISAIVAAELYKGVYLSSNKREAEKVVDFIRAIEVVDFNNSSARLFGEKYAALRKAGKLTQEADLLIASTALANNANLVTRNARDFKHISGLKLIVI